MPYLIVNDGTIQTIAKMRESKFTRERAALTLAAWFPNYQIISPDQQTQKGDKGISVYLQDNNGGRIGKPQGWALRKLSNG